MPWQVIATNLSDPTSIGGRDILGSANYMTACLCMTTHQQPDSVYNTGAIQKIELPLGKSSVVPGGAQLAIAVHFDAVTVERKYSEAYRDRFSWLPELVNAPEK